MPNKINFERFDGTSNGGGCKLIISKANIFTHTQISDICIII